MKKQSWCPVYFKTIDKVSYMEKDICLYTHPFAPLPCEDKCGLPFLTRFCFREAAKGAASSEYIAHQNNLRRGRRILESASKGGREKKGSLIIKEKHSEYKKMAAEIKSKHPQWSKREIARQIVKRTPIDNNAFRKDKTPSPEYLRKLI